ncbi:hypothetical protein HK096_004790 [Nowakowskiella sp. JEL0078]|nr:hypothetical protein HK096_004790 [Nowakowskiella sp. JEL0078]
MSVSNGDSSGSLPFQLPLETNVDPLELPNLSPDSQPDILSPATKKFIANNSFNDLRSLQADFGGSIMPGPSVLKRTTSSGAVASLSDVSLQSLSAQQNRKSFILPTAMSRPQSQIFTSQQSFTSAAPEPSFFSKRNSFLIVVDEFAAKSKGMDLKRTKSADSINDEVYVLKTPPLSPQPQTTEISTDLAKNVSHVRNVHEPVHFFAGDESEDGEDDLNFLDETVVPKERSLRRQKSSRIVMNVRFSGRDEIFTMQEWRERWFSLRYERAFQKSPENTLGKMKAGARRSVSLNHPGTKLAVTEDTMRRKSWTGDSRSRRNSKRKESMRSTVPLWNRARELLKKKSSSNFNRKNSVDSIDALSSADELEAQTLAENLVTGGNHDSNSNSFLKLDNTIEIWINSEWERLEVAWVDWCWNYPRLDTTPWWMLFWRRS